MKSMRCSVLLFLGVAVLLACQKDPVAATVDTGQGAPALPLEMYDYDGFEFPDHFSGGLDFFESIPDDNPLTDAGATLGRVLFYDRNLSANRVTRCASCHEQSKAFSDGRKTSVGHLGQHTRRNSSHLVNMQFNRRMFWDLRAQNLEQQVLMPIEDPLEMGLSLEDAISRIGELEYYAPLFTAAFGDPVVTADRVSKALSQFVRSIVSYQTRFDEGLASGFANFTPLEIEGKDLFYNGTTRCNQCHVTANLYGPAALNNGLPEANGDEGLGEVTGNAADMGKFKIPSLRNVELTGPYMHDGRFATLEEVVEHYNSGVQAHPFLDERVTSDLEIGGTPYQLELSDHQKAALVAFLRTLTDHSLLTDPKFSDPFGN